MVNRRELEQQIAKLDTLLQAAYAEGNKADIILLASLMAKLQSRMLEATQANKPEPMQSWKRTNENSRILARDEHTVIYN